VWVPPLSPLTPYTHTIPGKPLPAAAEVGCSYPLPFAIFGTGPGFSGTYSIAAGGLLTLDPDPWAAFGVGQLPAAADGSGRRLMMEREAAAGTLLQHTADVTQQEQGVVGGAHGLTQEVESPPASHHHHQQQHTVGRRLQQSGASSSRSSSGAVWGGSIQGTLTAAEASTTWPTAEEDAARGDNATWLDQSGSIVVTGPVPQFLLPSDKNLTGAARQAAAAVKPGTPLFWILVAVAVLLVVLLLGLACYLCIALRRRRQEEAEDRERQHSPVDEVWVEGQGTRRVRSRAEVVDVSAGPVLLFPPPGGGRGVSTGARKQKYHSSNSRPNSSPEMHSSGRGGGNSGGMRRVPSHNGWVTPTGDPSPAPRSGSPPFHR
jgi:hypothetical protein